MAGSACQLANISLVYVIIRRYFPNTLTLVRSVWALYILSFITLIGLTIFWDVTIDGHSKSFLSRLPTCTSLSLSPPSSAFHIHSPRPLANSLFIYSVRGGRGEQIHFPIWLREAEREGREERQ